MRAFALLVLVVCPLSVLAEEEAPPPRWSLGAGVSTTVLYSSCSGAVNGLCTTSQGPTADASVERRLGDATWLVLSGSGSISDRRQEGTVEGSDGTTTARWRYRQVLLDLGVRHVLTGRGALVDVSVLALAEGGYGAADGTTTDAEADTKLSSWILGANVGLALDRELSPGLSLRVATPLAGVWWQRSRQETGGTTVRSRALTASVYLAPRLELRLAF